MSPEPVDGATVYSRIRYSREQLLAFNRHPVPLEKLDIPRELRRKRRGCRAGVRRRTKNIRYRPSLPSVVMGNVRSILGKLDELAAISRYDSTYRECSLLLFTETWLTELAADANIELEGFHMIRADRTPDSGKARGGGVIMYVNNNWCRPGHITVKQRHCSKDIELLAVSMRPTYLPREHSHVICIVVYANPTANAGTARDVIHSVTSRLQTEHPDALLLISGDFNHVSLSPILPTFTQYVTCHTRDNKTLDLFYANTKEAYTSSQLPPLGRSDHNLVHLRPVYKPLVHRQPPAMHTVELWSEETMDTLKGCFEATAWKQLCDPHGEDIDGLIHTFTGYLSFCVDKSVPTKTIRRHSNNKPWINPEIKTLLREKKRIFRSGNREMLKSVQRELRRKIREGKDSFRKKMEDKLQQSDISGVWRNLKTISGLQNTSPQATGGREWANNLNLFFNRFDQPPSPLTAQQPLLPLKKSSPAAHSPLHQHPPTPNTQPPILTLTRTQVRTELRKIKARKAPGPDGISAKLLKSCADQLCGIVTYIFNMSLKLGRVPQLWKTSCVVPVPKTSHPKDLNSYRPVALTSHLMKTLERLLLAHLRPLVEPAMDPLQFAYQHGIGVEDAVIFLLHRSLSHLEKPGNMVRIMFFDFSSAFNTIQPMILKDKLLRAGVDQHLSSWILDYLTNRPQFVRTRDCVSDTIISSTGAPQGTVLAPFLFTLYTADFSHNTTHCHLQKFSDDSAIVGLISSGDEAEYRGLIQDFVDWCHRNCLQINARKTKELVVDCRRHGQPLTAPVNIQGTDIEMVTSYKYLGIHLNNKLDWSHNTDALYKKGQRRLFLLRRLRSFGVQGALLKSFYDTVVASAITFGVVCWGSGITAADRKRLNKLIKKASSVLGQRLDPMEEIGERRTVAKLSSLLESEFHPMQDILDALRSSFSSRLHHPRCTTERFRRSFLPTAVRLYNLSRAARRDSKKT